MSKVSPIVRSFNAGELSKLMEGRTDLERYPASLRKMQDIVAAPQGPAIARSGTEYVNDVYNHDKRSVLVPFVFSETDFYMIEFADLRVRFFTEIGVLTYAPVAVSAASSGPFTFTSATLGAAIGEQVAFSNFPNQYNLNGVIANITNKVGNVYTVDIPYPALAIITTFQVARVYHITSPYTAAQILEVKDTPSLDVIYLTHGQKKVYKLQRSDTYSWAFVEAPLEDGPYLPENEGNTTLSISATGKATPDMTSASAPSGLVEQSSNFIVGATSATSIAVGYGTKVFNVGAGGKFETGTIMDITNSSAPGVYMKGVVVEYTGSNLTVSILEFTGSGTYTTTWTLLNNCSGWRAFDLGTEDTYWQSEAPQKGWLQYTPAAPFVCDGYSIHIPAASGNISYTSKNYAPMSWTFEGWNGSAWVVLDKQSDYVLYDNNKSVFFKLTNTVAYSKYKIDITACGRNGELYPRIKSLVLRGTASVSLTVTANSITDINNGKGFLATDVGRLLRIKGSDNNWRALKITARASTTVVTATLLGEPFTDLVATSKWRLGTYSDTTGYPNTSTFHDDRLFLGGCTAFPDFIGGSLSGLYEKFAPTTESGEVLATSGISLRLNARRLSRVKWLASNKDGLAVGTGSKEYLIRSKDTDNTLNPKDGIKAVDSGSRGSSDCTPLEIDSQVLFVSRGGRTVREFAYTYESDGYKSPSMSSLASHLGISPFIKMAYAAEPFGIAWILRNDGTLVGLTYNRDENVVGWHRHDFNGVVESIAVLPSSDQLRDTLWLIVRRTINGQTRRYIEKLTRFWDFDMTLDDAWYVDCGLRYVGTPVTTLYGFAHLEGREDIYGLADGTPVGPLTVTGGKIELDVAASNIVAGIGFDSEGEISRLENGAQDGTAQGKVKRFNNVSLMVWQSYGGQIGVLNEQTLEIEWTDIDYRPNDASVIEEITLFDGIVGPLNPPPGYEKNGSLHFRRTKDKPLPFNLVALMPQMTTQDR